MPTLADYMMQRDQSEDRSSKYSLEADKGMPVPEWATRLGRAAAGGADYVANSLLNPNSKMDILRLIDQNPQVANWITMNLTPPGQMIQGSLDVSEAIRDKDAPWQNRLAQGAAGVLGMATAPLGVDTKLAGTAARGLNRLDELARSGELARPLRNEYGVFVGPGAKGWDELPGKFSSLADRMERAEIDDSGMVFKPKGNWREVARFVDPGMTLEEAIDHPELFKQYPELRGVGISSSDNVRDFSGSYNESGGLPQIKIGGGNVLKKGGPRDVILHEIQHAIQEREGFARGGSPSMFNQEADAKLARDALSWRNEILRRRSEMPNADIHHISNMIADEYRQMGAPDWIPSQEARDLAMQPDVLYPQHYPGSEGGFDDLTELVKLYGLDKRATPLSPMDNYRRLAGEIEARDVASRSNLTPEQRMATPPYSSENIPLEDWIVRKSGGGNAMSTDDPLLKDAPWRQGQIEGYVDDQVMANATWRKQQ